MRLAACKEYLDPSLTITANLRLVRGLAKRPLGAPRYPPEVKARAIELRQQGVPQPKVAEMCGVTQETVRAWCDPEYAARKSARTAEIRRQQRAERGPLRVVDHADDEHARAHEFGKPGRAAIAAATRSLAAATSPRQVIDRLKTLQAIARAWQTVLEAAPSQQRMVG